MHQHHEAASKSHLTCPASLLGRAAAHVAGRTAELSSISATRRCSEDSSDAMAATASVTFFCMSAMMRGAVFCCSLSACAPPALEPQMRPRPAKPSAASELQTCPRQVMLRKDITNCARQACAHGCQGGASNHVHLASPCLVSAKKWWSLAGASYLDLCNQEVVDATAVSRFGAARAAARQEKIPILLCPPVIFDRLLTPAAGLLGRLASCREAHSSKRPKQYLKNALLCIISHLASSPYAPYKWLSLRNFLHQKARHALHCQKASGHTCCTNCDRLCCRLYKAVCSESLICIDWLPRA